MTNDPEPPTPDPESDFIALTLAGLITLILFFIVMFSYWNQPSQVTDANSVGDPRSRERTEN